MYTTDGKSVVRIRNKETGKNKKNQNTDHDAFEDSNKI